MIMNGIVVASSNRTAQSDDENDESFMSPPPPPPARTTNSSSLTPMLNSIDVCSPPATRSQSDAAPHYYQQHLRRIASWILAFVERNLLIIGFVIALIWGLVDASAGRGLAAMPWASKLFIIIIFTVSGLTLHTAEAKAAVRAIWPFGFSVVSILAVSPLLAFLILLGGRAASDATTNNSSGNGSMPWGFYVGLSVFASVPTTLSSGVTLVANGKGNAALALMIVVVTNALGVIVTPLWIQAYSAANLLIRTNNNQQTSSTTTTTAEEATISTSQLDSTSLLINLLLTVLVPLTAGKILRELLHCVGGDGSCIDMQTHKRWLGHVSSLSLIIIVWMNVSVGEEQLKAQNGKSISILVSLGILFHLTLLALNAPVVLVTMRKQHTTASRRWWLPSKEGKAALFLTSQKTLPVSLTVLSLLPSAAFGSEEQRGLAAVACVVPHVCQLFMDGAIASYWAGVDADEEQAEATPAEEF